jgi:hypothetical protein
VEHLWYTLLGAGDVVECEVGWLVRTKGVESNEATGSLVLDSVLLV